jgi:3-deoxy-D-manno-octulosonic-acid transferase
MALTRQPGADSKGQTANRPPDDPLRTGRTQDGLRGGQTLSELRSGRAQDSSFDASERDRPELARGQDELLARTQGESFAERTARALYTLAWYLATPVALAYLLWRGRRQPAYRKRIGERLGRHAPRADTAPLIWIHAVSVGETRAAQPLIRALLERYPEHRLLLTHMTPTGLDTGRELFGAWMAEEPGRAVRVAQALLPWDYPFAIRRFLRAWRPSLGIVMETELWPNLTAVCRSEGVPLVLANARLSARSLQKGKRWLWLMRPALQRLSRVLAQTEADAQRIRTLGREDVQVLGNLKFDVTPAPGMESLGHRWRARLLGAEQGSVHRPAVVAASTRDGEEAMLLDAWQALGESAMPPESAIPWPPLLVIVPRHPQRFDEVVELVRARGFRVARRSDWGKREPAAEARNAQVLLGDSMGEMFAYYGLADVAIIGGSLLPFGGQNLIEPCAVGIPVVVGPHMFNFESATAEAIAADAVIRAPDAHAALRAALHIVADPVAARTMGERGALFAASHRGATARTLVALEALLPPQEHRVSKIRAGTPSRAECARRP